jgi:uncharacterized FlgJ-related protein
MGDQPQERKIEELCTPDIIDLPILNLEEIGTPFEIKTSTIRMVQHSPLKRIRTSPPSIHSTMSDFQHAWGDSRSNEGKAFSILTTREGFAMVPLSTGGDGAKLEHVDESFHEGILLAG